MSPSALTAATIVKQSNRSKVLTIKYFQLYTAAEAALHQGTPGQTTLLKSLHPGCNPG